jgi:hypothetical protein
MRLPALKLHNIYEQLININLVPMFLQFDILLLRRGFSNDTDYYDDEKL